MGGTVARWRSSSAPISRTPPASRTRRSPSSPPLRPPNEAELPSGTDAVAPVGMVSHGARGARAEDFDRRHPRGREQQAGRGPDIDVIAAGACAPRLFRRPARPRLERLADLGADLVAAPPDCRPDDRLDRAGARARDIGEFPEGLLEPAR